MKKFAVTIIAIAALLGACAAQGNQLGQTRDDKSSISGSKPGGKRGARQKPGSSDALGTNGSRGKSGGRHSVSGASNPSSQPTLTDTIAAGINKFGTYDCPFRPGDHCKMPWVGSYYLISDATGRMVFAAYENGSKTPTLKKTVAVVQGYRTFQAKMDYTVGLTAKTVTFHAWLEASTGVILAKGGYQTVEVSPPG